MSDLRFAFRQLLKNPAFAAVAVLTLAVGIGANAAIFSALNAVLLRPLPYRKAGRLVWIFASNPKVGYPRLPVSWASRLYSEWSRHTESFVDIAHFKTKEFLLVHSDRSEPLTAMRASVNMFEVLGVRPILGRPFLAEESELGRHRVVVLSYELWQNRFNGATDIVGQLVNLIDTEKSDRDGSSHDTLEPQHYTVVGVLPRGFRFPIGAIPQGGSSMGRNADLWEPESLTAAEKEAHSALDAMIGRLKPERHL